MSEVGTETTAPPIATPLVQVAGCSEVDPDGTCRLGSKPATLRLWVDVHGGSVLEVATGDGVVLEAKTRTADGGLALEVEVPAEAERVSVRGVDPPWVEAYAIGIRRWDPPEDIAELDLADPAAIETLEAALPGLRGEAWVFGMHQLRRAQYRADDVPAATRTTEALIASTEAPAAIRTRAEAASAAAHTYAYQLRDADKAQPFIDRLDELAVALPEASVWASFSRGLVARVLGDATRARDSFAEAERLADRLGLFSWQLVAMEGLAITLGELADGEGALSCSNRMIAMVENRDLDCRLHAGALNTIGWVQVLLAQAGLAHLDPAELFEEALEAMNESGACPDPVEGASARANLALVELMRGEPALALAIAEPLDDVPMALAPWLDELRARAALELGRWDLLPDPIVAPDPSLPRDARWNALMRQAATWERMGMGAAAIDAYVAAEAVLDDALGAIEIDAGRERFLAGKQESARRLVHALAVAGQTHEALCRARLARGRALRRLDRMERLAGASPESRALWRAEAIAFTRTRSLLEAERAEDRGFSQVEQERRRARREERAREAARALDRGFTALGAASAASDCSALPELPPGELLIAAFPVDEGWDVFVVAGETASARWVPAPHTSDQGEWFRHAFATEAALIEASTRIRVLATGASHELRWHALRWGDGALLDIAPVVYALDIEVHGARPDGSRALVVSDPSGDLPAARDEADVVSRALSGSRWTVEHLQGAEVSRAKVTEAIQDSALFHYAGHGEHAGTSGWGASLVLHDGQSLGIGDVLALPRGPDTVVLSGCDTGRVSIDTLEGGISLGRAFVLSGARWVIVTDTKVPDALSLRVAEMLYADVASPSWDGASALRRVQQALRAEDPNADWAAFRVLVP